MADFITNWENDYYPWPNPRRNVYHGEPEDITTESASPDLPVSVQEVKDYIRMEGFVDFDESTTESLSNFLFDDLLIERMIWAAVKKAEKHCGISIVFHTWVDTLTNGSGEPMELRMGPIRTFLYMRDSDEVLIPSDQYTLSGYSFKTLDSVAGKRVARYDAGYTEIPEEILLGLMQMVFYWYTNRKEAGTMPKIAFETLRPFRRPWTYAG